MVKKFHTQNVWFGKRKITLLGFLKVRSHPPK